MAGRARAEEGQLTVLEGSGRKPGIAQGRDRANADGYSADRA